MNKIKHILYLIPETSFRIIISGYSALFILILATIEVRGFNDGGTTDAILLSGYLDTMNNTFFRNHDSSLLYAQRAYDIGKKLGDIKAQISAINVAGEQRRFMGEFPASLQLQFEALRLNEKENDTNGKAFTLALIGYIYIELGDYLQALHYLKQARPVLETSDPLLFCFTNSHIGYSYLMLNNLDSAFMYTLQAYNYPELAENPQLHTLVLDRLGKIHVKVGQLEVAEQWYQKGLLVARRTNVDVNIAWLYQDISTLKAMKHEIDSALIYSRMAWEQSLYDKQKPRKLQAAKSMADLFKEAGIIDSAFYYQSIAMSLQDSIFGIDQYRKLQLLLLDEQQHVQTLERNKRVQKNRLIYSIIGLAIISLVTFILTLRRNSKKEKMANKELQQQKEKIQKTLVELQTTQSQLVHAEKMASLGELTAGIAHEIQNPLNFVNNFSEVSKEMIEELKAERSKVKGERDEVLEEELLEDVVQNLAKINHHGKRASDIVKGMLQHSRTSSGVKEPTDINALADEYLRLAYHGFRAKDKSFNAEFKAELDTSLPKANVVPQDIGRVLLNLINNAFYAVSEKSKLGLPDYVPTVMVITKIKDKFVEIRVRDNGDGIPAEIKNKIFQPFFTTKPTGEGTGLGLSLSYDIITKGHNGLLEVDTTEGIGTEFIVQLALNSMK